MFDGSMVSNWTNRVHFSIFFYPILFTLLLKVDFHYIDEKKMFPLKFILIHLMTLMMHNDGNSTKEISLKNSVLKTGSRTVYKYQ